MTQVPTPVFDPNAQHQQKPHLRPVRGFPGQTPQGQPMLGLADARQITDRLVYVTPAVQQVLPLMDGSRTIDQIVQEVGRGLTRAIMEQLVAQFDDAGLLVGPKFEAILAKVRADFDGSRNLPPASTAQAVDQLIQDAVAAGESAPTTAEEADRLGAAKLRSAMDQWISQALEGAASPRFEAMPRALVAPHLDYGRGWVNYAASWGRMRGLPRPDRVLILGTNHFGFSTGVCGCDKGFETPLGVCEADQELIAVVRRRLGGEQAERLFENRYDHEREHSIELQVPWVQHCLGADGFGAYPRVFGVLVHDPAANAGESYDGAGVGFEPFIRAMGESLREVGGQTLIVSSADLSHVGPAFGDKARLAGDAGDAAQFRTKVFAHDREMLGMLTGLKADELLASMCWQQNPTRWCSLGSMLAAFYLTQPSKVELLNYAAAIDPEGYTCVTSAGLAMM
jgi:MEMO1 family protein